MDRDLIDAWLTNDDPPPAIVPTTSDRRASDPPPALKPHPFRGQKLHPQPLTREECERLLRAPNPRWPTGVRNRALIAVLWRGMLRLHEALTLRPADFDAAAGTIRVLQGKGCKARTVALSPEYTQIVQDWLDLRRRLGLPEHAPLFCTRNGTELHQCYVRDLLPRMAKRAKIHKRVHAHGLRHSGATHMRQAGVDIAIISKALGHSSIATTAIYLDHLAPQQVLDVMRQGEW